jgi:hypothetical protein
MAIVHPDHTQDSTHQSIQIPSAQYEQLNVLAAQLGSSVEEVTETIINLMLRDNYSQLESAICQRHEQACSSPDSSLAEAYAYLGSLPETLEDARSLFEIGCVGMLYE